MRGIKIQKTAVLSLIILILALCTGCSREKMTADKLISIYNEKYNDNFTFISSGNAIWTADYDEIYLYSENLDEKIVVYYYYDSEKLEDNYMAVKYQSDIESLMCPLAEQVYGECRVLNIPTENGKEHLQPSLTLEDYVTNENSCLELKIITNKDSISAEEDVLNFVEILKSKKVKILYLDICYYENMSVKDVVFTGINTNPLEPKADKGIDVIINNDFSIKIIQSDIVPNKKYLEEE